MLTPTGVLLRLAEPHHCDQLTFGWASTAAVGVESPAARFHATPAKPASDDGEHGQVSLSSDEGSWESLCAMR